MSHDGNTRMGEVPSDHDFWNDPRAYVWRLLRAELNRLEALIDTNVEAFSSGFSKELFTAKAEVENAIALVVVALRAELAPKRRAAARAVAAPVDAPKRKRGRPAGARTRTPAEKDAAKRTIPMPGVDVDVAPFTNGTTHPATVSSPITIERGADE